jgi:hypothetical protein
MVAVLTRPDNRDDHPDDGGSMHFWDVSKLLPDYTAQRPRR